MADPISLSIGLICGGVKIAGSIAKYLDECEEREREAARRAAEYQAEQKRAAQAIEDAKRRANAAAQQKAREEWQEKENARRAQVLPVLRDKIFFVLAVLGQRLFHLDVVNLEHIPQSLSLIKPLWPNAQWREAFENRLDDTLRYAVVAALTFCAECWPMHIYRGFGGAVVNDFGWANPHPEVTPAEGTDKWLTEILATKLDDVLSSFKSLPRPPLLKKIPTGVSLEKPCYTGLRGSEVPKVQDRARRKQLSELLGHYKDALEVELKHQAKSGHVQPKDKRCRITERQTFWAGWDVNFACDAFSDSLLPEVVLVQSDPGRMLYAFTVGGHLELEPGQSRHLLEEHIKALVRWLHGLPGMTFDLILFSELDFGEVPYKRSTIKYFKSKRIDICHPEKSRPNSFIIVAGKKSEDLKLVNTLSPPPAYSSVTAPTIEDKLANITIQALPDNKPATISEARKVPPVLPARRRPVPPPPLPKVRVLYDFVGEAGELKVKSDQVLYVVKDHGDGWLDARLSDGEPGLIPKTFTVAV